MEIELPKDSPGECLGFLLIRKDVIEDGVDSGHTVRQGGQETGGP